MITIAADISYNCRKLALKYGFILNEPTHFYVKRIKPDQLQAIRDNVPFKIIILAGE